jgi:hypothetical protein
MVKVETVPMDMDEEKEKKLEKDHSSMPGHP